MVDLRRLSGFRNEIKPAARCYVTFTTGSQYVGRDRIAFAKAVEEPPVEIGLGKSLLYAGHKVSGIEGQCHNCEPFVVVSAFIVVRGDCRTFKLQHKRAGGKTAREGTI